MIFYKNLIIGKISQLIKAYYRKLRGYHEKIFNFNIRMSLNKRNSEANFLCDLYRATYTVFSSLLILL